MHFERSPALRKSALIWISAVFVIAQSITGAVSAVNHTKKPIQAKKISNKAPKQTPGKQKSAPKAPAKPVIQAKSGQAVDVEVPIHVRSKPKVPLEVISCSLTADGGFIDIRYMVRDKEAAKEASEGEFYILVESTGKKLMVPNMGQIGALKQNASSNGRVQFVLFANPAPRLEPGEKVTLVLGKLKKEHLELR